MLIEHIWTHLLTPVSYALLIFQLGVYAQLGGTNVSLFVSVAVLSMAFLLTHTQAARPIHVERAIVLLTLALSYLTVLPLPDITSVLGSVHIHDGIATTVTILIYDVLWFIVVLVSFFGILRSRLHRRMVAWIFVALVALLLAIIPVHIQLATDPMWLTGLRFNVAFFTYVAIALAEVAYATEYHYYRLSIAKDDDDLDVHAAAGSIEMSISRSIAWCGIVLWPIFVRRLFFIFPLGVLGLICYIVSERWYLAREAHSRYHDNRHVRQHDHWSRPSTTRRQQTKERFESMSRHELISLASETQHTRKRNERIPHRNVDADYDRGSMSAIIIDDDGSLEPMDRHRTR